MRKDNLLCTLLAAGACLAGCNACREYQPMPGTMNCEGVVLRTQWADVGTPFTLERREVLIGPVWNDVFPLNVASAKPVEQLISRLYRLRDQQRQFISWAVMPRADGDDGRMYASPVGARVLFNLPDVTPADRDMPRRRLDGLRRRRVAIYSDQAGRAIRLEQFAGVWSVGEGSHWDATGQFAAFSTVGQDRSADVKGLAVVHFSGRVLADPRNNPALRELLFIGWSPDGKRIAALRPATDDLDGAGGGELVELDIESGRTRPAGQIEPELAVGNLAAMDRVVTWSGGILAPVQ